MITVGFCTRQHSDEFIEHLYKSFGLPKDKIQIIEIINNGDKSLTHCYNQILGGSIYNHIVYLHNDIEINTLQVGSKILKHFEKNPEYGIIGVAGTRNLISGQWWEKSMTGIVNHEHEGKKWTSKYSNDIGNNLNEVVVLDGVFFAIDKTKIKCRFNEEFEGFHFYDISFCFENYLQGVKLGVFTNIRITHQSIGMVNEKWGENKKLFEEKYGSYLPIKIKRVIHKGEKLKILLDGLSL
jgi:hypothetical protein